MLCPECLEEGYKVNLGPFQESTYWTHAGRKCPECGEFFIEDDGYVYEPDPWMGDADPGL